ncbi:tyrosine-type recombinase/integrase [Paracoccus tegillarcae]|uniref:Integrase n=1 Tax=Paracoccus tegillarcae TaxID=1529068 RepID=A0A2K9ESE4_9RHOB|nr:tyrosine-type recombinase/integrase [Paracoccus tegillarcae]AUH34635.1 integrase [Paracoccus tegillarcae]
MKRKNPFPGVTRAPDRHGKARWRLRRVVKGTTIDCYLPGPYGSAEFRAAYEAALEGARIEAPRAKVGTLGWLVEHYLGSIRFKNLSDSRKRSLRGELDWLRREAGPLPFARFEVAHVEALMGRKAGPTAANTVKKNLSLLFNYAIKNGFQGMQHNPARHADRMKENPDGYHTMTDAEIDRYLAVHGEGTKARLALLLILNTGAARQDVCRLGWQNVSDGRIAYRRGKTKIGADLPILPELATELVHLPRDQMLFLTHGNGRPYTVESFGNWFKDQTRAAGLAHCSSHSVRKAGATRLANAGATPDEIRAFLAHKTNAEGATYTNKADRARLADSGLAKLTEAKTGTNVSNLANRLDKVALQPNVTKGKIG